VLVQAAEEVIIISRDYRPKINLVTNPNPRLYKSHYPYIPDNNIKLH
jgi:hypothetical protein